MATEWTQYDAKVVGTGSLGTRFKIKADEPDTTAKTVKIYWEAWLTANPAAGYYDAAEGTPCDLFLGQNQVYNKRTVFDLRNGLSEQKIAEGSHTVSYSDAPDGSITFSWTFDGRAYWDQIKQPTIISGKFQLPELTVDYTPTTDKAEYMLGEPVIITTNAPSADYTHDISYLSQGKTQTDIQKGVTDRVQWTVPEDEVLQAPTTTFFNLTIKVDANKDGKVLFSKSLTIKVNIPEDVKPKLKYLFAFERNEKVKELGMKLGTHLRLISKVRVSFNSRELAKGTSISKAIVRIKEKPEYTLYSDDIKEFFLPPLPFPETGIEEITLQGAIVDSRGRMSEWIERKIKVLAYSPPTIGAITPIRSGDTVLMKRNWSVSSIEPEGPGSEKNTATLSFFVRPQGGEWVENTGANATALSGKDSEATLLGTFPGNAYFEVKVRLSDKLATVEAGPFNIPTEGFPVSVSSNNKVGINKLVDKDGAQVQIRGAGDVMELDSDTFPALIFKRAGKDVAKMGVIHQWAVDNLAFIFQNYMSNTWFRIGKDFVVNGRIVAYDTPLDHGKTNKSLDNVPSGFNRIQDGSPKKEEHWSLSQTWLSASGAEGFQIAWMPVKNDAVLYRRTKRGGVWKPWKEF